MGFTYVLRKSPSYWGRRGLFVRIATGLHRRNASGSFTQTCSTVLTSESMLKLHQHRRPAATLGVYQVADPTRCGIAIVDREGIIREFVEKPEKPATNLAFSGVMIGTPRIARCHSRFDAVGPRLSRAATPNRPHAGVRNK